MKIIADKYKPMVTIITERGESKIHKFGRAYKVETDSSHNREQLRLVGNYLLDTDYFKSSDMNDASNVENYLNDNVSRIAGKYLHGQRFDQGFSLMLFDRGRIIKFRAARTIKSLEDIAKKEGWYSEFDSKLWYQDEFKINI